VNETVTVTDSVAGVIRVSAGSGAVYAEMRPPMPTVPEVNMARAWVEAAKPALTAANLLVALEGLLQFADRLLDLHK
jgi:hypothetical protein